MFTMNKDFAAESVHSSLPPTITAQYQRVGLVVGEDTTTLTRINSLVDDFRQTQTNALVQSGCFLDISCAVEERFPYLHPRQVRVIVFCILFSIWSTSSDNLRTNSPDALRTLSVMAAEIEQTDDSSIKWLGLQFEVDQIRDIAVVKANGMITLGMTGSSAFRDTMKALLRKGVIKVVIDMSMVTYCDSSALPGEFLSAFVSLRNRGGNFVLASPRKKIKDLLEITKMSCIFRVFADVPLATAYLTENEGLDDTQQGR